MRDHDAIDGRGGEQFIDALGQFQQNVERHVLRSYIRDLFSLDVRELLYPRNGFQHGVNRHSPGGISGLCTTSGGACNCSARCKNDDVLLVLTPGSVTRDSNYHDEENGPKSV